MTARSRRQMGEIDQEGPEAAAARLRLARVEARNRRGAARSDRRRRRFGLGRHGAGRKRRCSARFGATVLPIPAAMPRSPSAPTDVVPARIGPARFLSLQRVMPSAVSPLPARDRPPCADAAREAGRGRCPFGSARSCPGSSAVLDATGVRDDGIAGGEVLGVLENSGGRPVLGPDCSPLAAAPSLIRLKLLWSTPFGVTD